MRYKYKQMCAYDDNWSPRVQYNWDPSVNRYSWFSFLGAI